MTLSALADRARFGVGAACVLVAACLFVVHAPRAIRTMNATVKTDAYITNPLERVLTSGDMQGLPYDLQVEALDLIPKSSDYAFLLPADVDSAGAVGINSITFATAGPFLRYLLLPARPVDPTEAHYVICWHCDRTPWNARTDWLWQTDQGEAIGQVKR